MTQVRASNRPRPASGPKQPWPRVGHGEGQWHVHQSATYPGSIHHGVESRLQRERYTAGFRGGPQESYSKDVHQEHIRVPPERDLLRGEERVHGLGQAYTSPDHYKRLDAGSSERRTHGGAAHEDRFLSRQEGGQDLLLSLQPSDQGQQLWGGQ